MGSRFPYPDESYEEPMNDQDEDAENDDVNNRNHTDQRRNERNERGYKLRDGYVSLPRIDDLDDDDLANVENFRIYRESKTHGPIGEIRWLEPVDLRDVDLNDAVSIDWYENEKGKKNFYVSVYENCAEKNKPPKGSGLNKKAVAILYLPQKEGAKKGEKFERKLREQGNNYGKHVSYEKDHMSHNGISLGRWEFEVHQW